MGMKTVQDASLTSVADAIRVKAEIEGTLEFPSQFISAIRNIPTGGGSVSVPPKDVNFYDYDGTIVDAYTASDFASLSAMPQNPKHTGLTAQGWNWSLADAKAYVAKYGKLNIGQMYVTTSGDTEIDIQLGIGRNMPYLGCGPNGTVEIDWGDGSAHDTLTGTSVTTIKKIQHIYPDTGEMFTIKLHMESGSLGFVGNGYRTTGSYLLYTGTAGTDNGQKSYQNAIQAIRCGSHVERLGDFSLRFCRSLRYITIPNSVVTIGQQAFETCGALTSITIPNNVTEFGPYTFQYCHSLRSIAIPNTVTSISQYAFNCCDSLRSIVIPDAVASLGDNAICNQCSALTSIILPDSITALGSNFLWLCESLTSLTIPSSVTSIGTHAIRSLLSLEKLVFKSATPPTAASGTFDSLPSDLVVYVPAGTLADYQSASNYSSIASKMVEMSA